MVRMRTVGMSDRISTFLRCSAGLTLPTEKWKEILMEANDKTRKLEEDFEATCLEKRVNNTHTLRMNWVAL